MKQLPLALRDGPAPDFANFLPGSNDIALEGMRRAALAIDAGPGQGAGSAPAELAALIYLWGPSGSGKTHLMRALAADREERGGRVGWFSAADRAPWCHDDKWQLIVLDECDRYDAGQQQSAFSAFVEASSQGIGVVAAGRVPPVDLALRDDLRSRLGWGQVFALQPLTDAEVRSVLARETDRRRLPLSADVVDFLLTHFQRDLKHLMTLLDRLDDYALAEHRALTVPLLKRMMAEKGESS